MGPGERNIQQELRRQAAQVSIPADMWEKINERLDGDRVPVRRRQQVMVRGAQWRPALALVAAVGMLWITVGPSDSRPEPETTVETTPVTVDSPRAHYDTLPMRMFYRQVGSESEGSQPEERTSTPVRVPRSRSRIAAR